MAASKEPTITLIDIVADAREVGGQEYVDLLYKIRAGSEPAPEQDWRFQVDWPDGSQACMNGSATAADIAKYLEWERSRRR